MMRPLVTVPACLRCHEEAGRKPGEIRGGISVTVPMSRFASAGANLRLGIAHMALWLVGMTGLSSARGICRATSRRGSGRKPSASG